MKCVRWGKGDGGHKKKKKGNESPILRRKEKKRPYIMAFGGNMRRRLKGVRVGGVEKKGKGTKSRSIFRKEKERRKGQIYHSEQHWPRIVPAGGLKKKTQTGDHCLVWAKEVLSRQVKVGTKASAAAAIMGLSGSVVKGSRRTKPSQGAARHIKTQFQDGGNGEKTKEFYLKEAVVRRGH